MAAAYAERRLEIVVNFFSEEKRPEVLRFPPGTCVGTVRKRLAEVIRSPGSGRALSLRLYSIGLGRYLSNSECEDGSILEPGSYTAPCSEIDLEELDSEPPEDSTWPLTRVLQPEARPSQMPILTRQGSSAGIGALVVILGMVVIVLLVIMLIVLM